MTSATPTASPEALAATEALLSGGAKLRRSALSEAFDSFAAPVWKRVEAAEHALVAQRTAMNQADTRLTVATAQTAAAEKRANAAERVASVAKDTMTELREVRKLLAAETKRANDAELAAARASDRLRESQRKAEPPPGPSIVGWGPFKAGPLPEPKPYQLPGGIRSGHS